MAIARRRRGQTRRLVGQDRVLGIFYSLGTAPNAAIKHYLNEMHVPHLALSGASRYNDPAYYPRTMGGDWRPVARSLIICAEMIHGARMRTLFTIGKAAA